MKTVETAPSMVREYLDYWVNCICQALRNRIQASITGEILFQELTSENAAEQREAGTWICFAADRVGKQTFFLSDRDTTQMLRILGPPEALEPAKGPGARRVIEEFLIRIGENIPLAEWLGFDAQLRISDSAEPIPDNQVHAEYRFSTPESPLLVLHVYLSPQFAASLHVPPNHAADKSKKNPPPGQDLSPSTSGSVRDIRLELLMDVELELILRFGQREMLLRDVLNLTPGMVLELDQQVQDPVELLVGSKVIAWGEVVTVDGNYGLRITSLASRQERLASLRKY